MKTILTILAIFSVSVIFAQTDINKKKMVIIPDYVETYKFEYDQAPIYDRSALESYRTSYRRNTDIFVISNFNSRQPNIQVIINLPEPNTDNNLPHYINQMMFKPPKIEFITKKE